MRRSVQVGSSTPQAREFTWQLEHVACGGADGGSRGTGRSEPIVRTGIRAEAGRHAGKTSGLPNPQVGEARLECQSGEAVGTDYSGSGCPLVSGAKGRAMRPIRKTRHIVTPA